MIEETKITTLYKGLEIIKLLWFVNHLNKLRHNLIIYAIFVCTVHIIYNIWSYTASTV